MADNLGYCDGVMVARSYPTVGWLLVLAATIATWPSAAHANGGVVSFEKRTAGPYEISVGTIPRTPPVGQFHLTMTVADASTKAYLLNANVTVTGIGPEGTANEIGPLVATNNPRDPSSYEADPSVDREGTWVFTITVSGELGEESAEFPIEVRSGSPLMGIVTFLALVAFLAIIGLSIRAYLRERAPDSG